MIDYDQCSGDFSMSLNTIECSVVISLMLSFIHDNELQEYDLYREFMFRLQGNV
jgi:hypothetical protein